MKNIRKSVFETNSSSSHSIHIDGETILLDVSLLPDESGRVVLPGGEFGWSWLRFNDAVTKANYCAIPASGVSFRHLEQAIMEQTGAKKVTYIGREDYSAGSGSWSYIDHDSHGTAGELNDVKKVKNFVFNPNCWLVTGNDNSSHPNNIFDFPKTNINGQVENVEYRYRLEVDGITEQPQFKSRPNKSEVEDAIQRMTQDAKFYPPTVTVKIDPMYGQIYGRNFTVFKANGYQVLEGTSWSNGSEDCFEAEAYEFRNGYSDPMIYVNMRDKFFYVYSSNRLNEDIRTRGNDSVRTKWEERQVMQKELIKEHFLNYSMKISFTIVKI